MKYVSLNDIIRIIASKGAQFVMKNEDIEVEKFADFCADLIDEFEECSMDDIEMFRYLYNNYIDFFTQKDKWYS